MWYELDWRQQRQPKAKWLSITASIVHKRAGWTHAAKAILQYGLPRLELPAESDDATEHINALGKFAEGMAKWLQNFAWAMHTYKNTPEYHEEYQKSIEAMWRRHSEHPHRRGTQQW